MQSNNVPIVLNTHGDDSMTIKPSSLESEARATVPTDEAALHLCRKPQTLRWWASLKTGPLHPTRIHGRLHWSVNEIKRLLGIVRGTK